MRAPPRLPRKIWVGTSEVVIFVVPPDDPLLDGGDARGATLCELPPKIAVSDSLDPSSLLEVLWHELTHVINWLNEIEDGAHEERIAEVHGRTWPAILLANPKLQRWMVAQLNAIRKEQVGAS